MAKDTFSIWSNIIKALAGAGFTTAAAAYSAHGDPLMTGLTTTAAAGITAYDVIHMQITDLRTQEQQDILIELPKPSWWSSDAASWHGLCAEIVNHFPELMQRLNTQIQRYPEVLTQKDILQIFANELTYVLQTKHFTWAAAPTEYPKIAETLFPPILEKLGEAFHDDIERIQRETELKDIRSTASSIQKLEQLVPLMGGKPSALSQGDLDAYCQQYCQKLYGLCSTLRDESRSVV